MQLWDLNKTDATTRALAAGADSSSYGSSSCSDHNSGIKKKRSRDSQVSPATVGSGSDHNSEIKKKRTRNSKATPATVVITDISSFRAKVHKFTGMPTPPSSSTSEEPERIMSPLLIKPRAQRAEISVPMTTLPSLSSVLMNSTYCCNLPLTDHLVESHTSNSMLQLPAFSDNKSSNHKFFNSFDELLEELDLTEILQYEL